MPDSDNAFLRGIVTRTAPYGAFVRLDDGRVGMVHISKLSSSFVSDVSAFVSVGDTVDVKIIGGENGKLALSMIKEKKKDLEELLKDFRKVSEENQKALGYKENNRKNRRNAF